MTTYSDSKMRQMLQDNTYKAKLPYPTPPIKPNSIKKMKVLDYDNPNFEETVLKIEETMATATVEVQQYKKELIAYNKKLKAYREEENALRTECVIDMIDTAFTYDEQARHSTLIPALYSYAYEHGHSDGMYEVYNILTNMSNILEAAEKDMRIISTKEKFEVSKT